MLKLKQKLDFDVGKRSFKMNFSIRTAINKMAR